MLYESTGEVRAPKQGEYYLDSNCFAKALPRLTVRSLYDRAVTSMHEVIMHVVNEGQSEAMKATDNFLASAYCPYCQAGDDCMICGRSELKHKEI